MRTPRMNTNTKIAYLFSEKEEIESFAQMNKNAFYHCKHYNTPMG